MAPPNDEIEIRDLIARWSKAVRDEDLAAIRADHDPDLLMFDVPPPFLLRGLEAYMATWDGFHKMQAKPIRFDFRDVEVTAGSDVAFATAIGTCRDLSSGETVNLDFRYGIVAGEDIPERGRAVRSAVGDSAAAQVHLKRSQAALHDEFAVADVWC
jgi:ketosteroid isomerase-like protein